MKPLEPRLMAIVGLLLLACWAIWPPAVSSARAAEPLGPDGTVTTPLIPPAVIIRQFRAPITRFGMGHRGIDFLTSDAAVLLSPTTGTMAFSGLVALKPDLTVVTRSGLKLTVEPACTVLPPGTPVVAGQVIGAVCSKGYLSHCAPLVCLHFSARTADGYLSPQYLMGQAGPSRLVR